MPNRRQSSFYGADLSWLHSRYYSDLVTHAGPHAIRMLRAAGLKRGLVCDVGCGGGQLTTRLLEAGYEVVGVDISAEMVTLAKKRAPAATFIHGSIASVNLPPCNAAIAIGEVFNYLGSRRKMTISFRRIFRALLPKGLLIFDIKEPGGQKLVRISSRIGTDWAVVAEIEEDPRKSRLTRKIHSFRKVGPQYRRQLEIHKAGIYPASEVARMLRLAGFQVRVRSGYGSYRLSLDHKVIVAKKPSQ